MTTIGEKLEAVGGRPSGFDYLRLTLSVLVIACHSVPITVGIDVSNSIFLNPAICPLYALIIPMFFALSGFLVAGSLSRTRTLVMFLGLRGIRIFPALIMEVLLSALLLGAAFTTLPLGDYFTDPLFQRYLLNVSGHISYFLPGVFEGLPYPKVINGQLWTVRFELYCYISLALLFVVGAVKRPILLVVGMFAVQGALLAHAFYINGSEAMLGAPHVTNLVGRQLVFAFLAGVGLYLYKDVLPYSKALGILSGIVTLLLLTSDAGDYIAPFTAAYFTAYLGLLNPPKIGLIKGADYSYGLYLYGFPIQQALAASGAWSHHWYINLVLTLVIGSAFAAFSWHLVEKPALKVRAVLKLVEEQWLRLRGSLTRKWATT